MLENSKTNTKKQSRCSQDLLKVYNYFYLIVVISAFAFLTQAAQETYTVDSIIKNMRKQMQNYSYLSIDYNDCRYNSLSSEKPTMTIEATYKQDLLNNSCQQKRRVWIVDPNTGTEKLYDDTTVSFNGNTTFILSNKISSSDDWNKGFVKKGYERNQFTIFYADPFSRVWYLGSRSWAEILDSNDIFFEIEKNSELLDNLKVIKLVGHSDKVVYKIWICPERNFLPLKQQVWQRGGRLLSEVALYDLYRLPNGAWFPKTIKSPADPPGMPNPTNIIICKITAINLSPISPDDFSIDFPPETYVIDGVRETAYLVAKPEKQNDSQ